MIPSYEQLIAMTDAQIAEELMRWATVRDKINPHRIAQGQRPLDSSLLVVAAHRLSRGA